MLRSSQRLTARHAHRHLNVEFLRSRLSRLALAGRNAPIVLCLQETKSSQLFPADLEARVTALPSRQKLTDGRHPHQLPLRM